VIVERSTILRDSGPGLQAEGNNDFAGDARSMPGVALLSSLVRPSPGGGRISLTGGRTENPRLQYHHHHHHQWLMNTPPLMKDRDQRRQGQADEDDERETETKGEDAE
jgi:hypothetical protein